MNLIRQEDSGYPADWTRDEKLFAANVQQFSPRSVLNIRFILALAINIVAWAMAVGVVRP